MTQRSRYLVRVLLATAALAPVWWLATPFYNRYLLEASETLLHLLEAPNVSQLARSSAHDALLLRLDFPPVRQVVRSFRLTDLHFTALLSAAVILAQRIPGKTRLTQLLYALPLAVVFHLALVLSLAYSVYAAQLGEWSTAHYGPLARNGFALLQHLLHLPFKLALPLLTWGLFCYPASNLKPSS